MLSIHVLKLVSEDGKKVYWFNKTDDINRFIIKTYWFGKKDDNDGSQIPLFIKYTYITSINKSELHLFIYFPFSLNIREISHGMIY